MAEREYTESRQIADDLGMVPTNLIQTPELAPPGVVGGVVAQFFGTARAAARGAHPGTTLKLDTELRDQRHDPDFARIQDAIHRAAQQAENEERFR